MNDYLYVINSQSNFLARNELSLKSRRLSRKRKPRRFPPPPKRSLLLLRRRTIKLLRRLKKKVVLYIILMFTIYNTLFYFFCCSNFSLNTVITHQWYCSSSANSVNQVPCSTAKVVQTTITFAEQYWLHWRYFTQFFWWELCKQAVTWYSTSSSWHYLYFGQSSVHC